MDTNKYAISITGNFFLKSLNPLSFNKKLIEKFSNFLEKRAENQKEKFSIVPGGGDITRKYQQIVNQDEIKDEIGIKITEINSLILKDKIKNKNIRIEAGAEPGYTTDFNTVKLAKEMGASLVINLGKIGGLYNKNPEKHQDAQLIKEMTWDQYLDKYDKKRKPGMHSPFSPNAAKLAKKYKFTLIHASCYNISNLENILDGKKFKGSKVIPN